MFQASAASLIAFILPQGPLSSILPQGPLSSAPPTMCTQTLWYHPVAGGASRAKILHVSGIDALGTNQDPTICKLSPMDLLRAEAEGHATFAR